MTKGIDMFSVTPFAGDEMDKSFGSSRIMPAIVPENPFDLRHVSNYFL